MVGRSLLLALMSLFCRVLLVSPASSMAASWQYQTSFQVQRAGKDASLPELAIGQRQHPGSNHWGMIVGGGAMALLAVMNDPGVDMSKIKPLLEQNERCMKINLTQGFGDGGFFVEGDGTGSMSSHISFLFPGNTEPPKPQA